MKKIYFSLAIILISIPTFILMLKPGIYSMQDFHFFRLVEFTKCLKDNQIPCRWAPDAALGYGEPLFNFYGQTPYAIGSVIYKLGFSLIDSLKLLFIISLVGSGLTMYLLAKKIWQNNLSAVVSSVFYLYAPYRAVDVWVRGALPESFAFIFIPLIVLKIDDLLEKPGKKNTLILGILLALLITTHNLSVILFAPFIVVWVTYKLISMRKLKLPLIYLTVSVATALGLAGFYLIPVIFESSFINLGSTTSGYFDFRAHFATTSQLLWSRYWGYGGSTFGPEDGLNLSVGFFHWTLALSALVLTFIKKDHKSKSIILTTALVGFFALFMAHNKSTFIWTTIKPLAYLQFPWRFLGLAVFSFSLSLGYLAFAFKKLRYLVYLILLIIPIAYSFQFFRPDIWFLTNDQFETSSVRWREQMAASIGDYWPIYGPLPHDYAQTNSLVSTELEKTTVRASYEFKKSGEFDVPIAYFPGWNAEMDGIPLEINSTKDGMIGFNLPRSGIVNLEFSNTPARVIGNIVSLLSIIFATILIFNKRYE